MSDLSQTLYLDDLLALAEEPLHYGRLETFEAQASGLNASCGDKLEVWIHLETKGSQLQIVGIGWEGEGCVISRAAMSAASGLVIGKTPAEVSRLGKSDIEHALGLEAVVPGRLRCLLLGLKTINQALDK